MRKILTMALSVVIAVCLMPTFAFANESETISNENSSSSMVEDTDSKESVTENSNVDRDTSLEKQKLEKNQSAAEDVMTTASSEGTEQFQSLVDDAASGSTISLDENLYLDDTVVISKDLIIDLNGCYVYGNCEDVFIVESGEVIIKNGL